MPNLVLEKGGQTYRFKLHEDKSVTHNKFVPIPFNGKDYYARYGDTSTPLITEVNGIKRFIQYEPVDFQTVSWEGTTSNTKTVFFPKGRYVINMLLHQYKRIEVYVNNSEEKTITVEITRLGSYNGRYRLIIPGLFNELIYNNYTNPSYWIERIGD